MFILRTDIIDPFPGMPSQGNPDAASESFLTEIQEALNCSYETYLPTLVQSILLIFSRFPMCNFPLMGDQDFLSSLEIGLQIIRTNL